MADWDETATLENPDEIGDRWQTHKTDADDAYSACEAHHTARPAHSDAGGNRGDQDGTDGGDGQDDEEKSANLSKKQVKNAKESERLVKQLELLRLDPTVQKKLAEMKARCSAKPAPVTLTSASTTAATATAARISSRKASTATAATATASSISSEKASTATVSPSVSASGAAAAGTVAFVREEPSDDEYEYERQHQHARSAVNDGQHKQDHHQQGQQGQHAEEEEEDFSHLEDVNPEDFKRNVADDKDGEIVAKYGDRRALQQLRNDSVAALSEDWEAFRAAQPDSVKCMDLLLHPTKEELYVEITLTAHPAKSPSDLMPLLPKSFGKFDVTYS